MSSSQTMRFRTNRLNIWYISRHEPRLHSTFRTGDSWQCEHQRGRPSFVNLRPIRRRLPDAVAKGELRPLRNPEDIKGALKMKAVTISKYGNQSVLTYGDVER